MDSHVVTPISKASAAQRARLAARSKPGKCFRLYPDAWAAEMPHLKLISPSFSMLLGHFEEFSAVFGVVGGLGAEEKAQNEWPQSIQPEMKPFGP